MPGFIIHADQADFLIEILVNYGFDKTRYKLLPSQHTECNLDGTDFLVKVARHETTHPSRFAYEPREEIHQLVYVRANGDSIVLATTELLNNVVQNSEIHLDAFPNLPEYLIGHAKPLVQKPVAPASLLSSSLFGSPLDGFNSFSFFNNSTNEELALSSDFNLDIERYAAKMQETSRQTTKSLRRSGSSIPVTKTPDFFAPNLKPVYKTMPEARTTSVNTSQLSDNGIREAQQRFEAVYRNFYAEECKNPFNRLFFATDEIESGKGLNHYIKIALTYTNSKCYKTLVALNWLSNENPHTPDCVKRMITDFQRTKSEELTSSAMPSQPSSNGTNVLSRLNNMVKNFR